MQTSLQHFLHFTLTQRNKYSQCEMCCATSYTNLAVNGQINACINLFPSSLDLMRSEHFQRYSGSSLEKEKCIGKDIKKSNI